MNPESNTTELLLHKDDRLIAAIGAVVIFAAERASVAGGAAEDLAGAAADACKEAFSLAGRNGTPDPVVKVAITSFPDRVEIALEYKGDSCVSRERKNVDRVDCDVRNGISRATLVKYAATSKFEHHS